MEHCITHNIIANGLNIGVIIIITVGGAFLCLCGIYLASVWVVRWHRREVTVSVKRAIKNIYLVKSEIEIQKDIVDVQRNEQLPSISQFAAEKKNTVTKGEDSYESSSNEWETEGTTKQTTAF